MNAESSISIETLIEQPLPIFTHSAQAFQQVLLDNKQDLQGIGDVIRKDPGLVLHTLQQLQPSSGKSRRTEISSMAQAAMLMGTDRVQQLTKGIPQVEDTLHGQAKAGFSHAACRAFHAAFQAWDWAHIKNDHAPEEIFLAALLHDIAELALWVAAPERIHRLRGLIFKDRLHTDEAQYIALGESLEHFSRQIASSWHLPPLVQEALRPENANNPRVQGVMLAVQLSRAAERGWHTEKMQSTLELISEYLGSPLDNTISHIHSNAVRAARETSFYGARPAAALLPLLPGDDHVIINDEFPESKTRSQPSPGSEANAPNAEPEMQHAASSLATESPAINAAGMTTPPTSETISQPGVEDSAAKDSAATICLMPQPEIFVDAIKQLKTGYGRLDLNDIMRITVHGLHDGVGLNRVVFSLLTPNFGREKLISNFIIGADNDTSFSRFSINLDKPHLFTRLMEKPISLWINNENRNKYWRLVPDEFKALIKTNTFYAMSVHLNSKPFGLFYADRRDPECQMDEASYKQFRQLCQLASKCLAEISAKEK